MRLSLVAVILLTAIAHASEKVAAVVNGEAITVGELDTALRHLPATVTPVSTTQKRQQRADALQALIDDKLVRQYLQQSGPKIEPAEVDRQFAALIASQKAQGKSIEEYLKENDLTAAQVKESFLRILQLGRFVEGQVST